MRPLAIDLFCGLGGWTAGLLAEGYDVIGFDIEQHVYGNERYPAQLVLQDVLTLHGRQFKDAALIVASPPCQEYSYMAMPWTKAKARAAEYRSGARKVADLNRLFEAAVRIGREAGVPTVIENVRGAIPWVGRSRWNFGSYHLWGDVPALMPMTFKREVMKAGVTHRSDGTTNVHGVKRPGMNWSGSDKPGYVAEAFNDSKKVPGFRFDGSGRSFQSASVAAYDEVAGLKIGGDWFSDPNYISRRGSTQARKRVSAMIAKIPLPLSRHIARVYKP
jgi:hypothetical protein